jgi:hypothetical protein
MPVGSPLVIRGTIGHMPIAGVTWQVLHYLEGFRRLGFVVYYVEDTGEWPYALDRNTITDDPTYAVNCIGSVMARYGFSERWAFVPWTAASSACPHQSFTGSSSGPTSSST